MTKIMEDRWKDPFESDDYHWLPNMIEKKESYGLSIYIINLASNLWLTSWSEVLGFPSDP